MNESKVFELVKASSAKIVNDTLMIAKETAPSIVSQIKEYKSTVKAYLSGTCFRMQCQLFDAPVEWVVIKKSDNPYVYFQPYEVFRGTAGEVDDWMKANEGKPCYEEFPGDHICHRCQAKYVTAHA